MRRRCAIIMAILVANCLSLAEFSQATPKDQTLSAIRQSDYTIPISSVLPLANEGNADAQVYLGIRYCNGLGVSKNAKEAVKYFSLAAALGRPDAMHNLGAIYYEGDGVPQSYTKALKWFKLAAKAGHCASMFNLGVMYEHGEGAERDSCKAKKWFEAAAEQGEPTANLDIALSYYEGKCGKKNIKSALIYFEKAARYGNIQAIEALQFIYYSGYDVPQDLVKAYKWSLVLSKTFGKDEQGNVGLLEGEMSPEQIAQAKHDAEEWIMDVAPKKYLVAPKQ